MSRRGEEQNMMDKAILAALRIGEVCWTAEEEGFDYMPLWLRGQDLTIGYVTYAG